MHIHTACHNPWVTDTSVVRRPIAYAIVLIVAGVAGLFAAFQLTLDKFAVLINPDANLTCNISVVVECATNLGSSQGSLFGFPNPLLGLAGWVAPIVVGAALLAGARFDRWFRVAFLVGILAAMSLVVFLITTSIFVLGTLCIWCMLTWAAIIPVFWMVSLGSLRDGTITGNPGVRSVAGSLYTWIPAITLVSYLVIAVLAQLRLDVLSTL